MEETSIYDYGIDKLWVMIQEMANNSDVDIHPLELKYIKEGISIKIPIYWMTEQWYEVYPTTKSISIMGFGRYKLHDFMEEKDRRESMMRNIILRNQDEEATIPRV